MFKYINMNDINEINQLCSYINQEKIKINIDEEIENLKSHLKIVIDKNKERGTNCLEITFNTDYSYTKTIDYINKETVLKEIEEARAQGIKSIKLNGENIIAKPLVSDCNMRIGMIRKNISQAICGMPQ